MGSSSFDVELIGDVVLSARGATLGGHSSLSYLPGRVLLGAAASRSYRELEEAGLAFHVFHSGRVRFSPAYPVTSGGEATVPVPLSLHREKLAMGGDGRVEVHNLALPVEWPEQPAQLRQGYVSDGAERVDPPRDYRLKSSRRIREEGRGKEEKDKPHGALFGYESIRAGARFRFEVVVDEGLGAQVEETLVRALTEGPLFLGRSRSAEYGEVRITRTEAPVGLTGGSAEGEEVSLLLVSDAALRDARGVITATPAPELFGLRDARLVAARSFVRARRWSPFNGQWGRHGVERQVLVAGSVLTFAGLSVGDRRALEGLEQTGVGDHRAEGLGRVLVAPVLLARERFALVDAGAGRVAVAPVEVGSRPAPHPLLAWAEKREAARRVDEDAFSASLEWKRRLSRHAAEVGRAQWGHLRELAAQTRDGEALRARLFGKGGELRKGVAARRWRGAVRVLESLSEGHDQDATLARVVELTAWHLLRHVDGKEDKA